MLTLLKFLLAIALWIVAHRICERFPFEFMEDVFDDGGPKPYDYFKFYALVYMIVFLIIILIC